MEYFASQDPRSYSLYLIWIFDFGSKKLPGLSRNQPQIFNTLRPKSDQHQISPNKIHTLLWLIFYQILSTYSLRKCKEISMQNLNVNIEISKVKGKFI